MDTSGWSQRKKVKHRLLRRAFEQNRGAEVILLIQWRTALEDHRNVDGAKLARLFNQENDGQPQAIRALNLLTERNGLPVVYKAERPKPDLFKLFNLKPLIRPDKFM